MKKASSDSSVPHHNGAQRSLLQGIDELYQFNAIVNICTEAKQSQWYRKQYIAIII